MKEGLRDTTTKYRNQWISYCLSLDLCYSSDHLHEALSWCSPPTQLCQRGVVFEEPLQTDTLSILRHWSGNEIKNMIFSGAWFKKLPCCSMFFLSRKVLVSAVSSQVLCQVDGFDLTLSSLASHQCSHYVILHWGEDSYPTPTSCTNVSPKPNPVHVQCIHLHVGDIF